MTMDDYLDLRAYWNAHPPLQRFVEAYFKLKPRPVRRYGKAAKAAEVAGRVDFAELKSALGGV